jgi:effector-binding domain-containing protein
VCVPIRGDASAEDASIRHEPEHHEAYVRITKAQVEFPQILSAYDAVSQWITEHGRTIDGAPREVYFTDFMAAKPTDDVADVAFPIR